MSLEQIIQVELIALSKTIREYTTDNYIQSYAEQISRINYPEDKEKFYILVMKLLHWYNSEIKVIKSDKYIYEKKSHIKSYELLLQLKQKLEKEVM